MASLRLSSAVVLASGFLLGGCQIPYLIQSGYNQAKILTSGDKLQDALNDPALSETEKNQIRLVEEARKFAATEIGLNVKKNYSSFVKLDRPYVTYVVSASEKYQVKSYEWWFPIVGHVPYKGFFNEKSAHDEADDLKQKNLDVFVRGVSAYSTLGWFSDPLLSSMLKYRPHQLVNTIIHENVHATLYIKSNADFNEQLATFIGNKGTEAFYKKHEGNDSPTLLEIKKENADELLFSNFITQEIQTLESKYKALSEIEKTEETRQHYFHEIQSHFHEQIEPKLQTDIYKGFSSAKLNNAYLSMFKTYVQDLSLFEKLFVKLNGDFKQYIEISKRFESSQNPRDEFLRLANSQ